MSCTGRTQATMSDATVAHMGMVMKSFIATQARRIRRFVRRATEGLEHAVCSGNEGPSLSVSSPTSDADADTRVEGGVDSTEGSLARSPVGELGKDLQDSIISENVPVRMTFQLVGMVNLCNTNIIFTHILYNMISTHFPAVIMPMGP